MTHAELVKRLFAEQIKVCAVIMGRLVKILTVESGLGKAYILSPSEIFNSDIP